MTDFFKALVGSTFNFTVCSDAKEGIRVTDVEGLQGFVQKLAAGVPYDVVIHDYAWICPRVTLIDASGRYCGEPAVAVCEACLKRNGSELGACNYVKPDGGPLVVRGNHQDSTGDH